MGKNELSWRENLNSYLECNRIKAAPVELNPKGLEIVTRDEYEASKLADIAKMSQREDEGFVMYMSPDTVERVRSECKSGVPYIGDYSFAAFEKTKEPKKSRLVSILTKSLLECAPFIAACVFLYLGDKKIESLKSRVAQFPSEIQEMKRVEMDGNPVTREYSILVPFPGHPNRPAYEGYQIILSEWNPQADTNARTNNNPEQNVETESSSVEKVEKPEWKPDDNWRGVSEVYNIPTAVGVHLQENGKYFITTSEEALKRLNQLDRQTQDLYGPRGSNWSHAFYEAKRDMEDKK
ncbi:hypothetical protein KA107_03670 [Candidatus Pacearchaeota archaeon]|nr:hypothetical protein [Candidatus Pacearchaeota archaeon]